MKPLADLGVEVVGVSGDSAATQGLFKKEHNLPYTLLGDETGAVAKAFGVPLKAGGKVKHKEQELVRGVTAARWTYVIGKDGKIAYKNTKVAAADDAKAVREAVAKLK
jgi:peroxiredoxin Q/BCP